METKKGVRMQLRAIVKENRGPFLFTFLLLLMEAGGSILFPLFIGYAIDDAIAGSYQGAIRLGWLGSITLLVGFGRRVFDSRFYAKVYQTIGIDILTKMQDSNASIKSARLGMIRELVMFFEHSLPELLNNMIGLFGVSLIIATLNLSVFYASLLVSFLIFILYWITSKYTIQLNSSSNDELESQVDILHQKDPQALQKHLKALMQWNVKLSDLEAGNFSISWMLLMAFLVGSILLAISDGIVQYGTLFALVMYVFQYMESVVNLPFFYQNWLRLQEIKERIGRM